MATWDSLNERERDVAIAEKLGWTGIREEAIDWVGCAPGADRYTVIPHYTTDLTAAMGLAEEMRTHNWDVDIQLRPGWEYGCRIAPPGEFSTPNVKFISADTLPAAIAQAVWEILSGA